YYANGNMATMPNWSGSYDKEGRLVDVTQNLNGSEGYEYDGSGKRIWTSNDAIMFYGVDGKRMSKCQISGWQYPAGYSFSCSAITYFLGQIVTGEGETNWGAWGHASDRLGSVRAAPWGYDQWTQGVAASSYFPYGQARTGGSVFGTYLPNSTTGTMYAMHREYSAAYGRFLTPDPYQASGGPADPGSWNRYSYVQGDPVNYGDPGGNVRVRFVCGSIEFWNPDFDGGDRPNVIGELWCSGDLAFFGRYELDTLGMVAKSYPPNNGGFGPPENKGGWRTDPKLAAKDGWKRLTQDWTNCLDRFGKLKGFESARLQEALSGGMRFWDTRKPSVSELTIGAVFNTDEADPLMSIHITGDLARGRVANPNIVLFTDWFQDLTPTGQAANVVHEGLHVIGYTDKFLGDQFGLNMNTADGTNVLTKFIESNCP
ncbi:MAG: hypothetical protein NTY38_17355, partial [Acidobacteria bacterium]|nr:hypothetical protein [Acidobacteriota bacterium]